VQFVSLEFLGFLLALGALHWLVPTRRGQNAALLLGSLGFAATFRWWAPVVLLGAATFEWWIARTLGRSDDPKNRLRLLWTSIAANGFLLFFFRYNHFFAPEISVVFRSLGLGTGTVPVLSMVGASFWTLQKATLTLDTYAQRRTGDPDWLDTMVFVSFFPNLVSGPIERARDFMPQLQRARHLTSRLLAEAGWLFAIGTFKKVVVSDNIGRAVE
jgi:D-alanyl-lipoteichoic acid acyltransferase DltB (MBOAT superfamily)